MQRFKNSQKIKERVPKINIAFASSRDKNCRIRGPQERVFGALGCSTSCSDWWLCEYLLNKSYVNYIYMSEYMIYITVKTSQSEVANGIHIYHQV